MKPGWFNLSMLHLGEPKKLLLGADATATKRFTNVKMTFDPPSVSGEAKAATRGEVKSGHLR